MYDVVVIGAGPAGMNAAIYSARMGLEVGVVEKGLPGGQMNNTDEIENYIGYASITGTELSEKMENHMNQFIKEEDRHFGEVLEVIKHDGVFTVDMGDKKLVSKTVVLATGCVHRKLGVTGESEFTGRGVSYCAVCDGMFFKGKEVAVIGGGNSAIEEALYLANIVDKVTVIHRRDELRADKIYADRATRHPKIDFKWSTVVDEIVGESSVNTLKLTEVNTNEKSNLNVDGVFIYVGLDPIYPKLNVGLDSNEFTETNMIVTAEDMSTSVPGFFVIGDVRDKELRQIITSASDGAEVSKSIDNYLNSRDHLNDLDAYLTRAVDLWYSNK